MSGDAAAIWQAFDDELTRWHDQGQQAPLWWRDDDAVTATPALDRLLALSRAHDAPLVLAVIPAGADTTLARRLADQPQLRLAQHGWCHASHAAAGQKNIELGGQRAPADVLADLAAGQARLDELFAGDPRRLAMLVPPWNRIDDAVLAGLPALGFAVLSAFADRPAATRLPASCRRLNTHADPITWRGGRGFAGDEASLRPILSRWRWLREQAAWQSAEPPGLLTHHLVHDEAVWDFIRRLLTRAAAQAGFRWYDPIGQGA